MIHNYTLWDRSIIPAACNTSFATLWFSFHKQFNVVLMKKKRMINIGSIYKMQKLDKNLIMQELSVMAELECRYVLPESGEGEVLESSLSVGPVVTSRHPALLLTFPTLLPAVIVHTVTHSNIHTHTHLCTSTHTYAYAHTHVHTHTVLSHLRMSFATYYM